MGYFSPTGYVAFYLDAKGQRYAMLPIVRFDDEGYALVLTQDGRLIRAADRFEPDRFGGVEPLIVEAA